MSHGVNEEVLKDSAEANSISTGREELTEVWSETSRDDKSVDAKHIVLI